MNIIPEWGALGELNNNKVVATSLGSFFLFYIIFKFIFCLLYIWKF